MITLPIAIKTSLKSTALHIDIEHLTKAVRQLEKSDLDITSFNPLKEDIYELEKTIEVLKSLQDKILDKQANEIAQDPHTFKQFFAKHTHVCLHDNAEQLCSKWEKIVKANKHDKYFYTKYSRELKIMQRLANKPYYLYRDNRDELHLFDTPQEMVKFKLQKKLNPCLILCD